MSGLSKDELNNLVMRVEGPFFRSRRLLLQKAVKVAGTGFSPATFLLIRGMVDYHRRHKGPIAVSDLAKEMDLSLSATTQLLNILDEKKLIRRKKSEMDRRVTHVTLSIKGWVLLGSLSAKQGHAKVLVELLEYMGEDDAKEFARLMDRVGEFLDTKEKREKKGA